MVNLLAVHQEVLHVATAMLISGIIARAQAMEENKRSAVYGMASLLVVFQKVPLAVTVLIFEVIALVLTMEVNGPTVVYGKNSLLVVCQEALHATTPVSEIIVQALTTRRSMWAAATMLKSVVRGKTKFRLFTSSASEVR